MASKDWARKISDVPEGTRRQWKDGALAAVETHSQLTTGGSLDPFGKAGHTTNLPTRTRYGIASSSLRSPQVPLRPRAAPWSPSTQTLPVSTST